MNKRIVVYTALIGKGYDNILQPAVISEDVDYICFVRKGEKNADYNGIWRIEELDYDLKNNVCLSRYPKLMPHKTCVSGYEYSLYIDANVIIKDSRVYDRINELVVADCPIAMLQHPYRDCVYQDAYICIAGCRASWWDVLRQIVFLKYKRFPKHYGLFEANVIFRKHNDKTITEFGELWWKTFMRFAKRDQLSQGYAMRETSVHPALFLPKGYSTRNHPWFEVVSHLSQKETTSIKIKKSIVKVLLEFMRKALKENPV